MLRSILAVFAGMVLWAVLWLGSNAGIQAIAPESYDPEGMTASAGILALILFLSVFYSIVAGYLTATIARRKPIAHTVWLGVIQLAIGIFMQAQVWSQMPLWYHLPFLVLLIPGNVIGGILRGTRD